MPLPQLLLVSRADRLGDLVLCLPALAHLKRAGVPKIILHTSDYARAVGLWAQYNGIVDEVLTTAAEVPAEAKEGDALAFFHHQSVAPIFARVPFSRRFGPRTKVSALWRYQHTLAQHRSRVEKSEMQYNLDLSRYYLKNKKVPDLEFQGLPALRVPDKWKASQATAANVVVVSNLGSALNWSIENYLGWAKQKLSSGEEVDFLVHGLDEEIRKKEIRASGILSTRCRLIEKFATLEALIVYLSRAKYVVSSSTGPLHIAHALGVPVFGLYPKIRVQSFARWRPEGFWHSAPVEYLEI